MKNKIFPIYFAYEDNCDKITSAIKKLSCEKEIEFHILHKGISEDAITKIKNSTSVNCYFDDVSKYINQGVDYYKFAIEKVCKHNKAIYIDADSEIDFNINTLFNINLGDYYACAHHNSSFDSEIMSSYTEKVLGISHYVYACDDILVLNIKELKKSKSYERFSLYVDFCNFSVSPAEALFNLTCKDNILLLNSSVATDIDEELAIKEMESCDSFLSKWNKEKRASDRVEIVNRIAEFEHDGKFDQDVEDDVPGRMLMPDEIEYIKTKRADKLKAKLAFKMAKKFYYALERKRKVIIDSEVEGLENFANLDTGAVITCNHFNAMDSFAMHWLYLKSKQKKRILYRIIREGNYTSFPGFFGFLMRNFYTLPLSSNHKTMRKFLEATNELLQTGHFVLVYPEQSMWWNYRKPKPLKPGGFNFAAKNNVPVLPIFITMRDSDVLGEDGYYVQKYKMHVGKPIYPNPELNARENTDAMMKENERVWQEIYEREYQMPLEYTTEKFTLE